MNETELKKIFEDRKQWPLLTDEQGKTVFANDGILTRWFHVRGFRRHNLRIILLEARETINAFNGLFGDVPNESPIKSITNWQPKQYYQISENDIIPVTKAMAFELLKMTEEQNADED